MTSVLDNVVDEIKYMFYVQHFFLEKSAFYEIIWKNMAEVEKPQITI